MRLRGKLLGAIAGFLFGSGSVQAAVITSEDAFHDLNFHVESGEALAPLIQLRHSGRTDWTYGAEEIRWSASPYFQNFWVGDMTFATEDLPDGFTLAPGELKSVPLGRYVGAPPGLYDTEITLRWESPYGQGAIYHPFTTEIPSVVPEPSSLLLLPLGLLGFAIRPSIFSSKSSLD